MLYYTLYSNVTPHVYLAVFLRSMLKIVMKIQIILGSTRPNRTSPQISQWLLEHLYHKDGVAYEIVDLQDWNLPLLDEPNHPRSGQYTKQHTFAWSDHIKQGNGYIFLTPEYNAGYPAPLKNAIDYLAQEWRDKPALIVSYGIGGGTTASAQLKQVLERLGMPLTKAAPALVITPDMRDKNNRVENISAQFSKYETEIETASHELIDLVEQKADS